MQSVTCQVKAKQSRHLREVSLHIEASKYHLSASEISRTYHSTRLVFTVISKISLKKSLCEEKHENMSLFHVCVFRCQLVSGLNLLCRKDTMLRLAINKIEYSMGTSMHCGRDMKA